MEHRRRFPLKWLLVLIPILAPIAWRLSMFVPVKLQIGPETTYVDGPLVNGKIDYAAALHARLSAGIKPKDNAAILIDQAFGPQAVPAELRSQYFAWIGSPQLPEQGDYVISQTAFAQSKIQGIENPGELNSSILDELSRAGERPWTRAECPQAAEWLDANEKPLVLIVQASRCSAYYSPLVTPEGLLQAPLVIQNMREAARLLTVRAMLRLGENDADGAWSDLYACHRLARLAAEKPHNSIEALVTIALDAVAAAGDAALIGHGLTADQARQCQADFARLPPTVSLADAIDFGERLTTIDAVLRQFAGQGFEINAMLRRVNQTYDKLAAAMRLESFAARRDAAVAIESEIKKAAIKSRQPLHLIANALINTRRTIGNSITDTLLGLMMPALSQFCTSEFRSQVRHDQVQIGFALAAFHAEQGSWPKELTELVPKYLKSLPVDRYSDKPYIYRPADGGFLLYSAGPNGKDEAGLARGQTGEDDVPFEVRTGKRPD